jgi:hypothetical protein
METHQITKESENCYLALGIGNWFSWHIVREYEKWVVSSIYGKFQGAFETFDSAIESLTTDNLSGRINSSRETGS